MEIKRAYRFRFYPTPEQEVILARTFGCARFAYNHMLRLRTDAWYQRQERVGYHETSAALTALKKTPEHAWLNEVSSVPVQQALRHLQTAFANFFAKRAKCPNFRRKDGEQSAEYTTSAFKWDGNSLTLAKMKEPLAIRWSRAIPKGAKVTTCTVSKDTVGRFHVSMLCDDVVSAKQGSASFFSFFRNPFGAAIFCRSPPLRGAGGRLCATPFYGGVRFSKGD
ncbi:RNA-guided endonuclease InsQ/TnpB family protein [Paraburkholderia mimosarum]|uniref:RNA-guided endonuclease InsQ/TnpB family protein n=1 Tax=Paraburkholderia mimosarum TaxID=312026 RepID=UPI0039C2A0EC